MNRKTTIIRLVTILATISLLMLSLPVPVLAASIGLSASSGPPGTVITVSGSGFGIGESYSIIFAPGTAYQTTLFTGAASGTGTFTTQVTIPFVPFNQYVIRVNAADNPPVNFEVIASVSLSSSSGNVGNTLLVSGAGFRSGIPVFVFFNNVNIVSTSSDTSGVMTPVSFAIPAVRAATYNVYATDGEVTSPSVVFNVVRLLRADSTQGSVGSTVQLEGTGFDYNSGITIFWDNRQPDTPAALFSDNNGKFLTNITVPASTRGSHTIRARDNIQGFASTGFEIISSLAVDPANSGPGRTVSLAGNGFRATVSVVVTFDGTTITTQPTTITTDTNGAFLASFTVSDVVSGSYLVKASDSVYAATATLVVTSSITLAPDSGNVGTEVTVTGTGFSPGGSVTLSYDNQTPQIITADSGGNISTTFSTPASAGGQHTVSAQEAGGAVAATAIFTMESTTPPAPDLLAPAADSLADVQSAFSWLAVTDPSGVTYDIQVAKDSGFTQLLLSKTGLAQNSYQLSQTEKLEPARKSSPYYWRVRAIDGASNASDWPNAVSFYTQDSTPPDQPTAIAPAADSLADQQPAFSWSVVTDPGGVTYDFQIARDSGFSQLLVSKTGLVQNSYQIGQAEQLEPAKKTSPYYWRVRATDTTGNANDWTSPISFYTQDSTPPPAPLLLSPANSVRVGSTPLLNWSDVSDPQGVNYSLQVALDAGFSEVVLTKDNLTKSEYKLAGAEKLPASTGNPPSPYFWRVRASDGAQNQSDWTVPGAFYVGVFQGALLYAVIGLGGLLLLVIGIFIGMRIRPVAKPKA